MNTLTQILGSPKSFLDEIFKHLDNIKLNVTTYELDHICYRVATIEEYLSKKSQLSEIGNLLVAGKINGREISTFKLYKPIFYKNRQIDILELPSPKKDSHYPTGYEHVEFVVNTTLEDFEKQYQHLDFDKKAMKKSFNKDLRLSFGKLSVKFHEQSLEKVIEIEKKGWKT